MWKKGMVFGLIMFLAAGAFLAAETVTVSFLEGTVESKNGASWKAVNIGDILAADTVLRLAKDAWLELQTGSFALSISRSGTYALKDILDKTQQAKGNKLAKALSGKLNTLSSGKSRTSAVAAGVRAEKKGDEESLWVDSTAAIYLDAGQSFIKAENYPLALEQLQKGLKEAEPDEVPALRFWLAYTLALGNDNRKAHSELVKLAPQGSEPWFKDYILLKARIYLDGLAWEDSANLLVSQKASLAADAQRAPMYFLLLGSAYKGLGKQEEAKAALKEVQRLAPDTGLAEAALSLLVD